MVNIGYPSRSQIYFKISAAEKMWKLFGPLGQFASLAGNNDASHSRGELINIGDMKRNFLVHDAGMHINVFNFGHPMTKTTFNSYILQLPDGDYSIYREWLLCLQNWVEG